MDFFLRYGGKQYCMVAEAVNEDAKAKLRQKIDAISKPLITYLCIGKA